MKPIPRLCAFLLLMGIVFHISCKRELSCEGCGAKDNKPPIAIAGPDQVITLPKDSVLLDGSSSFDPDGKVISYKWNKISGPASANVLRADSSKTVVKSLTMGVYNFELLVKDNRGLTAKDTVQLIVDDTAVNQLPIANAENDQTIILPIDSALLNGCLSFDPDGNIISYQWLKIAGPTSFNINNLTGIQTTVRNLIQGVYSFELSVTDNGGLSAKDTVLVNVITSTNRPPVARAGLDQTITLPANTITLNGSGSTDPDNNITTYEWTKIAGPTSFSIANTNAVQTQVTNLVQGNYQFAFKVTDAGGLFSTDTVQITVFPQQLLNCDTANRPIRNASFSFFVQLPEPRYNITVATVGNKFIVAGGNTNYTGPGNPTNFSNRVDIYDITTGQWTFAHLPQPRIVDAVAVLGNKIFFAGGWNTNGQRLIVDIYDITTDTWSAGQFTQARSHVSGGTIDNKAFFAGGLLNWGNGNFSSVVDIYDASTNLWSTASLSQGRYCISDLEKITITAVGHRVFFAGGSCNNVGGDCSSNRIDIYDASTNTWSYEDYIAQNGGSLFPGVAAGNKNYFVTGSYWDGGNRVEIRDETTHTTSYTCLSGILFTAPFKNGNKLFFPVSTFSQYTPDWKLTHFDVCDLSTNSWSISKLSSPVSYHPLFTVNNEIYGIGGYSTNNSFLYDKIYKLNY